jgi:UDP-N-acetylmuramyl pentapeptide phosphotransferase/UDP-N-acetylglucosamine-1-phosphate transferase
MIIRSGHVSVNYKGNNVPGIMGISIVISSIITLCISIVLGFGDTGNCLFILLSGSFISLSGLLDDLIGNNFSKGFRGHILCLLRGDLTTGALKAILGGLVAFLIAKHVSVSWADLIINTLIIGLTSNIINLFDVRPGRAIKIFFVISLYLIFFAKVYNYLTILLGSLLAYFPMDIKSKAMLGDTGSNFIGIILGSAIAMSEQEILNKLTFLAVLITFNIISEKVSFSKTIEKNKILRFIDELGRE